MTTATTTFKPGDRVVIREVNGGSTHYVGHEAEFICVRQNWDGDPVSAVRLDPDDPDVWSIDRTVWATRVEKVAAATRQAEVGDRVRIKSLNNLGPNTVFAGREGVVVGIEVHDGRTLYAVEAETGSGSGLKYRPLCTEVEKIIEEPTVTLTDDRADLAPGTLVRIIDVGEYGGEELNGAEAEVLRRDDGESGVDEVSGGYVLRLTDVADPFWEVGDEVYAEVVETIEEEVDDEDEDPLDGIYIDPVRVQALHAAALSLGDRTIEEILDAASWILGEEPAVVATLEVEAEPAAPEIVAMAPVAEPDDLLIEDKDGDVAEFEMDADGNGVAYVNTSTDGAYLTAADIDRLIAWLQQARAARA